MKALVCLLVMSAALQATCIETFEDQLVIKYGNDYVFTPTLVGEAAITINQDNTVLDLNGFTVSQLLTSTFDQIKAIYIEPNLSNIIIKNGRISTIKGSAIYVSPGCSSICISDMTFADINDQALFVDGSSSAVSTVKCVDSIVHNCGSQSVDQVSIYLNGADHIFLDGLSIEQTVTSQAMTGIFFDNCQQGECNNVVIQENNTGDYIGIQVNDSGQLSFVNVTIEDNVATGTLVGIEFVASATNLIEDCLIDNNQAGSDLFAINFEDNTYDNSVEGGVIKFNTGYDVKGIRFISQENSNGKNTIVGSAIRFNLGNFQCDGIYIQNANRGAIITSNLSFNSATNGACSGLRIAAPGGSEWTVQHNRFTKNFGSSDINSFGINVDGVGSSNLFTRNLAFLNGNGSVTSNQLKGLPIGIILEQKTSNLSPDSGLLNYGISQ